jgi:hypothetical protein
VGSREDEVYADEVHSIFSSTTGGVMTEEVGAVTGDLEVATRPLTEEGIEVTIRYVGAEEWYTVEGSPIELDNSGSLTPPKLGELHESVVRHLTTPGMVVEGNEGPKPCNSRRHLPDR